MQRAHTNEKVGEYNAAHINVRTVPEKESSMPLH